MYRICCLLPHDRQVFVQNHALVEWVTNKENNNEDRKVIFYDSLGHSNYVSVEELSTSLSFNYIHTLLVFHEKILREMLFCMQDDDSSDDQYDRLFECQFINPGISVRFIGVINGIDVGYGVFAEKSLPADEWIGEYVGVVQNIGVSDFQDASSDAYAFLYPGCNSAYEINALEYGNIIRFVNHSKKPNAEFRRLFFGGLWHIVVFTIQQVKAGEQITVSYGETYWNHKGIVPADI